MNGNDIVIREFRSIDREKVRRIACETAFLEENREDFFDDNEILADALTLYYTDYEPDSCFVAVHSDTIAGYIIGAKDVKMMQQIFNIKIIPKLIIKTISKGLFLKKNIRKFLMHVIISFFKGEFFTPDFSRQYPATLHINIDKDSRKHKIGTALVERYLNFLRENRISGVHFSVISESAKTFFTKLGFAILFEGKRSYLRYYLGKDIPCYVLGKRL